MVYLVFIFEMFSFVIKIAIDVIRAVELDIIIPAHALKIGRVNVVIVETPPNEI